MSPVVRASAAYVCVYTAVGAIFPYLPLYYRSLGFDLHVVGAFAALAAGMQLLAAPAWGALADRFPGSRLVLPASASAAALAAVVLALVREPLAVAASVATLFAASAGVAPILDARAMEIVHADRDRYGRLRAWGSASFIVSVVGVGWLVDRQGIGSIFLVYVPALVAIALVGASLPPLGRAQPLARFEGIRQVLGQDRLRGFFAAALIAWSSLSAVNAFFSIHLIALGAPGTLVGSAWALGALTEIPIMWSFPLLARRFGAQRLLVLGTASMAVRALVVALVGDPVVLVLSMVLGGTGFALLLVGGITYVARHAPPGTAATAQGLYSGTTFGLSMIVGSSTGGVLADLVGIPAMAFVAALGSASAGIVLWLLLRPGPVPVPEQAPIVREPGS
jgi:PPP family 3-phenylpropionic acid transporter